jgi:hypothetical protein
MMEIHRKREREREENVSEYRERKKGFSLSCIIHSLGKCFFTVKFSQECGENETETERERNEQRVD